MKKKLAALLAASGMVLAIPGIASADNFVNNIDSSVDAASITAGGSTRIGYKVNANGGDGQTGCNASDGSPATVSITVPAGVTATGTTLSADKKLTFSTCGDFQYVTFGSNTAGSYFITHGVSDSGVGDYNNQANWTLNVAPAPSTTPSTPTDTTPPVIAYLLDPAPADGSNGWYKSSVSLTWTVTENESASSLVKTGCVDQIITGDQAPTTYSCSATSTGGTATKVDVTIKRDGTAPTVSLTGTGTPVDGGVYYRDELPTTPGCTATDLTSGFANPVSPCDVEGFSTLNGTHRVKAVATDLAGNTGQSATVSYEIKPWTSFGYYSPVRMGTDVMNAVKGGSTVPLKFELFKGATEITSTANISYRVEQYKCDGSDGVTELAMETTGSTQLRYDATDGQFIQNWKTPTTKGACYRAIVTPPHGAAPLVAQFQIR